jgi:hypothetical protein
MSKRCKKIDPNQKTFEFIFKEKIDRYIESKNEILDAIDNVPPPMQIEDEFEACIEIAAAIKRALRTTNMSRPQIVDKINDYFGRSKKGASQEPRTCRKPLSLKKIVKCLSPFFPFFLSQNRLF